MTNRTFLLVYASLLCLVTTATAFVPISTRIKGSCYGRRTAARTIALAADAKGTASKKSKKAASPENLKKADFIAAISERTGLNKKESESVVAAILDVIMEEVGNGKKVSLPGFGSFTLKHRAARKGRNPQTGEELQIKASVAPGFSVAKAWKEALNSK